MAQIVPKRRSRRRNNTYGLQYFLPWTSPIYSKYEGCSINNETVLIPFWFAFNWNKSQYYCEKELISYLMSQFYRLMSNNIGTTSFSITTLTHYRPRSKCCANDMFSWLIKSLDCCHFITVWWNSLICGGLLQKWLILMFIILVSLYFVKLLKLRALSHYILNSPRKAI